MLQIINTVVEEAILEEIHASMAIKLEVDENTDVSTAGSAYEVSLF